MGATWDVALAERLGGALGEETLAKGAHVPLAPTVNLQRDPLGGRHFECMAEDPVLTARLAAAYVRGVQSAGVGACAKHLVANDAEDDRFEVSSDVDERTLREVYLLPFGHRMHPALWTAANTGMRRSELAALHWGDIDLYERRLSVNRSLVSVGYELHESRARPEPHGAGSTSTPQRSRSCTTAVAAGG